MISACLIVKNEERWIQHCLESLKPLVSEIIVADTGSTDKTLSILKDQQIDYFQIPWKDDFGWARNQTIEKARQPWILSFDADEAIALKDIYAWKRLVETLHVDETVDAVQLVRRNYIVNPSISGFKPCSGEYSEERNFPGYYEERMTRLFRNKPTTRWQGTLHEMIEPTLKGRIHISNLVFHHYGYTPMEERTRQKSALYRAYGERKIQEFPNDWKAHLDLGCEYLQTGEMTKAVEVLSKARQLNATEPRVLANLGYALMECGRFDESRQVLDECLRTDPKHHDGLLNFAVGLMRQKRFVQALGVFQQLLNNHPESFLAYKNQGLCFLHLKNPAKGVESFTRSLELLPTFSDSELDLAVAYIFQNQVPMALHHIGNVLKREPQNARAMDMKKHLEGKSTQPSAR